MYLVACLKGGVGKTTVAVQTALALARRGIKTGILDLDYRTPNVPIALDGQMSRLEHSYDGDILIPADINGIKVMSMAYIWPEWKCVQVEDADAMQDVVHLLTPGIIDWDGVAALVVDTPPTSTGVVKVALEAPGIAGALIVSHASRVSRMDAIRTIDLFAEKRVPITGLICNQSVDENGSPRYDLEVSDIKALADQHGLPFFANIPHIRDQKRLQEHFDAVAEALLTVQPKTLTIKEPSEEAWKKLVLLSKRLSGRGSS